MQEAFHYLKMNLRIREVNNKFRIYLSEDSPFNLFRVFPFFRTEIDVRVDLNVFDAESSIIRWDLTTVPVPPGPSPDPTEASARRSFAADGSRAGGEASTSVYRRDTVRPPANRYRGIADSKDSDNASNAPLPCSRRGRERVDVRPVKCLASRTCRTLLHADRNSSFPLNIRSLTLSFAAVITNEIFHHLRYELFLFRE